MDPVPKYRSRDRAHKKLRSSGSFAHRCHATCLCLISSLVTPLPWVGLNVSFEDYRIAVAVSQNGIIVAWQGVREDLQSWRSSSSPMSAFPGSSPESCQSATGQIRRVGNVGPPSISVRQLNLTRLSAGSGPPGNWTSRPPIASEPRSIPAKPSRSINAPISALAPASSPE